MNHHARSNEPKSFAIFDSDERRKEWAIRAEKREGARLCIPPREARRSIARKWGVSFWTLTNWHSGRLKDLRGNTRDRIEAGILREIEAEICHLKHDLEIAKRCGVRGDPASLAAETQLSRIRSLLEV